MCSPHFLCFPSHIINHLIVSFNSLSSHFLSKVGAMLAILVLVSPMFDKMNLSREWINSHNMLSKFYTIVAIFLCILYFIIVQF